MLKVVSGFFFWRYPTGRAIRSKRGFWLREEDLFKIDIKISVLIIPKILFIAPNH
jgi:hypothetical protein